MLKTFMTILRQQVFILSQILRQKCKIKLSTDFPATSKALERIFFGYLHHLEVVCRISPEPYLKIQIYAYYLKILNSIMLLVMQDNNHSFLMGF